MQLCSHSDGDELQGMGVRVQFMGDGKSIPGRTAVVFPSEYNWWDLREWLTDIDCIISISTDIRTTVYFTNKQDAILFSLKWS